MTPEIAAEVVNGIVGAFLAATFCSAAILLAVWMIERYGPRR